MSLLRLLAFFALRPRWWGEGIRAWAAHIRYRWWARPPFLPLIDRDYWGWRKETLYGDRWHPISPDDLVDYLRWRKEYRESVGE